jgi:hypothetical protein
MKMSHFNKMFNARTLATFALLMCVLIVSPSLYGQGFGTISGVVQDSSGAVIPGAKVVIDNVSKGIHREMETTGGGVFNAPALVPAPGYSVKISKASFGNYEAKNITVTVGENVNLSPVLGVSTASSVEVTGEAPIVDQTKTDNSNIVNSQEILDLPINGRRVDSFVVGSPGVTSDGTFGLISFRGNPGGNSFLTDGNDTTNQFYDENAGRTRTFNISQDAVQEFQVVSSNFLAEYGRASGGVVNTVTRSGTNSYHGTAYEFFRNRTLNATDITAKGINPPEWRHQAGVSVGGPIKKDKLFFFFNGELQRRNAPIVSSNLTTLQVFDANGNYSPTNLQNSAQQNCATGAAGQPTVAQCNAAIAYLQGRVKAQLIPRNSDVNLLFGKLDYHLDDRNSLSFSANYLDFRAPNGIQTQLSLTDGNAIGGNADTNVFDRTARASWTFLASPNAVNEFRYGLFKDRQFDPASPSLLPSIGPVALTVTGVGSNVGYANGYPRLNPSELRHQLADTYSWSVGKHNVKFGADWAHIEDYVSRLANRFGTYSYSNLSNFALDFSSPTATKHWNSYSQAFGNPVVDTNMAELAFFVQDQWRITPKLTITPGVRYEYSFLPQPTQTNSVWPLTGVIPTTSKNFAPRLGLAYSIDSKTVVRGGYGIFFNRYTSSTIENVFVSNGLLQSSYSLSSSGATGPAQVAAGPAFPAALATAPAVGGNAAPSVTFLDPHWRNPYSQQATLAIEREVMKDTSLSVSYVWSRGAHLLQTLDANAADPGACPQSTTLGAAGNCYTYAILDAAGTTQVGTYTSPVYKTRVNPAYNSQNYELQSSGNSYYSGLLVNLSRRQGKWFQGNIAYTYSHAIDNNQGGGGNTLFGSSFPTTAIYNGNYQMERGSSSSDQRHRLSMYVTLSPTFTHSDSIAARYLVNNWQLSIVDLAASSAPITPTIQSLGSANAPTGALNSTTLNGLNGSFRVPWESTSYLDMGPVYRTDARLTKTLPITERVKANLAFEAFNVFNHVIVTGRTATQYIATKQGAGAAFLPGIITLKPNGAFGNITATQGAPDGTSARRAQVAFRLLF